MRVHVLSLFRDDDEAYIDAYLDRVNNLDQEPHNLRFTLVEGDSRHYPTRELLSTKTKKDSRFKVLSIQTGIPRFDNIINPHRMKCLATTANYGLDDIASSDWADYILILESDLYTPNPFISALITYRVPVIAPFVWLEKNGGFIFYDIWAFRFLDGNHFPQFNQTQNNMTDIFPVSSAGSCLLIEADYIRRGARYSLDEAIVGLCKNLQNLGATIWACPTVSLIQR